MRIFLVLLTFLVSLTVCTALQAQNLTTAAIQRETFKLGIIHTNDTHGQIQPFSVDNVDGWGGVARRSAAIEACRSDDNFDWLLLDAGDICGDTPLSDLQKGTLDLTMMNEMGYDAMCLGNCDFGYGYDGIKELVSKAGFPVLCANIATNDGDDPVVQPYVILQRGQYRIGVIGLIRETFSQKLYFRLGGRVRSCPVIPAAKGLSGYLRGIGCDIVIALTHQGYDHDLELAAAVPEIDVIVGGHSHTVLTAPERAGDVIVTQDGERGSALGVLRLEFRRDDPAKRFSLVDYNGEFIPLGPDKPVDGRIAQMVDGYQREFDGKFNEVVVTSARDFSVERVRYEENAFADLVADVLLEKTSADCVLFTGGHFQGAIKAGPVTFGDLYNALPADNILMKVTLSGAKLRETLNWAGQQYGAGFPQVAGMRIRYVDAGLTEATIGGQPLSDTAEYELLMSDFLACSTDGFPIHEDPFGPGYTGVGQRTAFIEWVSQQKVLDKEIDGRVVFDWIKTEPPVKRQ